MPLESEQINDLLVAALLDQYRRRLPLLPRAVATAHPLRGDKVRALRELRRQFPDSAFVFATVRGGPFTLDAVNRLIKRIGERARLPFAIHAPSPTPATTRGAFRIGSATNGSNTPRATRN